MLGLTEERFTEVVRLMAVLVEGSGRGAIDLRTTEDWRVTVDWRIEGLRASFVVSDWEV